MKINIINSLLLLIFNLKLIICSSPYLKFSLHNYIREYLNIDSIPDEIFNNNYEGFIYTYIPNIIYTKIKLGTPSQELYSLIDTDEFSYYLFKNICKLKSNFYQNESSSFNIPDKTDIISYKFYNETVFAVDTIYLNEDKINIKNFDFMFMEDPANNKNYQKYTKNLTITNNSCFTIGLNYNRDPGTTSRAKSFTQNLINSGIIDYFKIFIEYNKNGTEEVLIIGEYPENLDEYKNKYNLTDLRSTQITRQEMYYKQYGFKFNYIKTNETKIGEVDMVIKYNLNVICGVNSYRQYLQKNFFKNFLEQKICEMKAIDDYTFIVCDKNNFGKEEMKKFPQLKFVKIDFETEFILTYEDLFLIKGDKVYFLVVFHRLFDYYFWSLGTPFLKKYSFLIDFNENLIWYYKKKERQDENMPDKNTNSDSNLFYYILIGALAIISCVLFFFFGKIFFKWYKQNKKIKAEELINEDEPYNYTNINNN